MNSIINMTIYQITPVLSIYAALGFPSLRRSLLNKDAVWNDSTKKRIAALPNGISERQAKISKDGKFEYIQTKKGIVKRPRKETE